MTLTLNLPEKLSEYVANQVAGGCYIDAEEVIRDAVRHHAAMEYEDDPALEAALLEGVRSPKQPWTLGMKEEIKANTRRILSPDHAL